jgi:hypothetical protein
MAAKTNNAAPFKCRRQEKNKDRSPQKKDKFIMNDDFSKYIKSFATVNQLLNAENTTMKILREARQNQEMLDSLNSATKMYGVESSTMQMLKQAHGYQELIESAASTSKMFDAWRSQGLIDSQNSVSQLLKAARRNQDFGMEMSRWAESSALSGYQKMINEAVMPLQALTLARNEFLHGIDQFSKSFVATALESQAFSMAKLVNSIDQSKFALQGLLPLAQFKKIADEFDTAKRLAAGAEWSAVIQQLRDSISAGHASDSVHIFDEIYRSARQVYEESGEQRKSRVKDIRDWIAFILAIYALMLALSGDADIQDIKAEQQIHRALLVEVNQGIRRLGALRERKFVVMDRPATVYSAPENGAKRIGGLKPMQSVIQIDHRSKWIRVEYQEGGMQMTGWVLKKYLERLPQEPAFDE